jgi:tetraacyldisaccharide 4'-kinase
VSVRALKVLAFPISCLYAACIHLRWGFYSSKLIRAHRLSKPVVCVGNLSMGGTGKTPTVIAIGGWLAEAGQTVSVLTRGYKGNHSGGPFLVSDGSQILATAESAGDEPLVIARNLPGALVTVGKNRYAAGCIVETQYPVDVHLLDDGFQHLKLCRSFNLLLIDVTNPWADGLPPMGRRREPLKALRRADAVLLTRCQQGREYEDILRIVRKYHPQVQVFHSRQRLAELVQYPGGAAFPVEQIVGKKVLALSGIGNPAQFQEMLLRQGALVSARMEFPDHHRYGPADYQQILRRCRDLNIDAIATTEKDSERLDHSKMSPVLLLVTKLTFTIEEKEKFMELLWRRISGREC